jgi:hypothetical protein
LNNQRNASLLASKPGPAPPEQKNTLQQWPEEVKQWRRGASHVGGCNIPLSAIGLCSLVLKVGRRGPYPEAQ